jgi:ribonuclease VapC
LSKIVLDSSAFLAVAHREPAAERLYPLLQEASLSAINATEVVQKLVQKSMTLEKADEYVRRFVAEIVPFDYEQAVLVCSLFRDTPAAALSLGDRACLALGKQLGAVVFTADPAWLRLNLGVQVECIRGESVDAGKALEQQPAF